MKHAQNGKRAHRRFFFLFSILSPLIFSSFQLSLPIILSPLHHSSPFSFSLLLFHYTPFIIYNNLLYFNTIYPIFYYLLISSYPIHLILPHPHPTTTHPPHPYLYRTSPRANPSHHHSPLYPSILSPPPSSHNPHSSPKSSTPIINHPSSTPTPPTQPKTPQNTHTINKNTKKKKKKKTTCGHVAMQVSGRCNSRRLSGAWSRGSACWSAAAKACEPADDRSCAILASQPSRQRLGLRPVRRERNRVADGRGERGHGKLPARDRRRSHAQHGEPGCPERLVCQHRHGHGRHAGPQTRRRGACASMMDHRSHPREQPVVRQVTDDDRIARWQSAGWAPGQSARPGSPAARLQRGRRRQPVQ